ncbi:Serpin B3, partial [Ophiophagus hannah]
MLKIASRLYGSNASHFLEQYVHCMKELYNSDFESVDFMNATEEVRQKINSWVERQTNGDITNFFPANSIDQSTAMVLLNTVFFRGKWKLPFNPNDTQRGIITNLTYEKLQEWTNPENMKSVITKLSMPKFTVGNHYPLRPLFSDMGVKNLFIPGKANLSGMTGNNELVVSQINQGIVFTVSEEGADAAGASRTEVVSGSHPEIKINKSFFFLVKHKQTGMILFMGRICAPKWK